ncbi:MAG TPA: mechanosensitive ion channel protein MscS, partial [Cyanobacteria bacterium UBA12227]|nr:mechanosensitive ion channel protein MscS [Cyanobacteria bacterium UBA12227]
MVLLGGLTLLLTLISVPSSAQVPLVNDNNKAPVVLDGRVLFEIGNFGNNYTAAKRADSINKALAEEVRSPKLADIEVIQEND